MKGKNLLSSLVICGMISATATCLIVRSSITASADCFTPGCLARTNCARWPPGQQVTVYINENDFNPTEQAAIKEAFTNWQNSQEGVSGVTFNFVTVTAPPDQSSSNYQYVQRSSQSGGGETNIDEHATSNGHQVNQFRYRAKVKDTHDAQLGRWAWDVFLLKD